MTFNKIFKYIFTSNRKIQAYLFKFIIRNLNVNSIKFVNLQKILTNLNNNTIGVNFQWKFLYTIYRKSVGTNTSKESSQH